LAGQRRDIMELVESAKKNLTTGAYAQFSGRASRSEYWWFALASVLVIFVAAFVDGVAGSAVVTAIAYLFLIIPGIAVSVRRLHDTNRSGWYLLLNLVPLIGSILIFIWSVTPGDKKANQYGPPSK
jgi:uncharacterized membrane protein YhaH (DUF805 family)